MHSNTVGVKPVEQEGVALSVYDKRLPHTVVMSPTEAIGLANGIIREALLILERSDGSPAPPRPDHRPVRAK
jgi:hypothetical protein